MFCKLAFVCGVRLKYIKPLLTPAVPYLGPTQAVVWKQKAGPPDEKKRAAFVKDWNKGPSGFWVGTSPLKPISKQRDRRSEGLGVRHLEMSPG